jgi:transposase
MNEMPPFRGQRELTNREKLLPAIYKNSQNDPMRQADIEQCQKDIGVDENTLMGLVDELLTLEPVRKVAEPRQRVGGRCRAWRRCPMRTTGQRQAHDRGGLRYPSDLTDGGWALVEPPIPPAKRGGRERTVDVREVLNGIPYILAAGCQWRALPEDLPPRSTVHDCLTLRARDGTLRRLRHALLVQAREQAGEEAGPTAAITGSQSVKSAEKGASDRSGMSSSIPKVC